MVVVVLVVYMLIHRSLFTMTVLEKIYVSFLFKLKITLIECAKHCSVAIIHSEFLPVDREFIKYFGMRPYIVHLRTNRHVNLISLF